MTKVEGWLVIRSAVSPHGRYGRGHPYEGQNRVVGVRIVKSTVKKPALNEDEIAIKVDFDVDEGWFLGGIATVQASIPAPPSQSQAIAANVSVPVKPKGPSDAAKTIQRGGA